MGKHVLYAHVNGLNRHLGCALCEQDGSLVLQISNVTNTSASSETSGQALSAAGTSTSGGSLQDMKLQVIPLLPLFGTLYTTQRCKPTSWSLHDPTAKCP